MQTPKPIESEHPFLRNLSPDHLSVLNECAEAKEFREGEVIFREGDIVDGFYLLEQGRVHLGTHTPACGCLGLRELGPGDVLGWSWLFPANVWHFEARAVEPTRAVAFNGQRLLELCERDHQLGYGLMKRLAQVLIRRLQASQKDLVALHSEHPETLSV